MSAIVKVEDLTYIYNQGMPDETVALDHVSFEIEEGEFVGVIGSTGCGKTTFLNSLTKIYDITSGQILQIHAHHALQRYQQAYLRQGVHCR